MHVLVLVSVTGVRSAAAAAAGLEAGTIKHVPSTGDLIGASVPANARRAASDLGGALEAEYDIASPRSDASDELRLMPSQSLDLQPRNFLFGRAHLDADQGP